MSQFRGQYPADWPAIAKRVKEEAGWCCVRCGMIRPYRREGLRLYERSEE